jgi:glycosyltransferase involved in cell wall biosynthesis
MPVVFLDLTCLARKLTGIENYTLNLFKKVLEIDDKAEYHVLFRKQVHQSFQNFQNKNVTFHISPFKSQLLTEQLYIPLFLMRTKFDVQIFPCFPPGIFVPVNNLQTICYDAVMWLFPETLSLKNKLYFRPLTKRALKKAKNIFTISESSKEGISSVFPHTANKIVNIKAALPEGFSLKPEQNPIDVCSSLKIKTPFLLSVGSLEPRKNLLFTLRSLELLLKEKNLQLVLVGRNAWGTDEVSTQITRLGLQNQIVRTGYISTQQLNSLYSTAKAFIFPSLYEGFGFPILEAFSCGCPVISSDTSSIPEVAGDAALLIDPHNERQLRAAVISLFENPTLGETLRGKGLQRVTQFSWEYCARTFLKHSNCFREK